MKKLTVEFTPEELGALTNLAADQLFRKQFIDPKMPGYRENPDEMDLCKNVVSRLRNVVAEYKGKPLTQPAVPKRKAAGR